MDGQVLAMAIIFTVLTITCIVVIVMNTIVLAKLADAADRISTQFATFGTQLTAFNATARQLSSDVQAAATAIGDQIGTTETAITDALTSAENTITSALTTAGTAAGGAVLLLSGKITANTTALDALTAQLQATPP